MSTLIPVIEITDDDPRWHELQRIEHEARLRFAHSDEARRALAALHDPNRERPDWKPAAIVQQPPYQVTVWD